MRTLRSRKFNSLLLTTILLGQIFMVPRTAHATDVPQNTQPNESKPGQTNTTKPASQQDPATATSDVQNGITVGQPKQFDERTLTLILQELEDKLAKSQFPDPSALFNATGRFAGATATTTSAAVSVRGPSTPSIATTTGTQTKDTTTGGETEGTSRTRTRDGTETTSSGTTTTSSTSGTSSETTNTGQQVITQPSFAPPIPSLPSQTSVFAFQPQFGISAQDLLSEQTSLFYQIVNLRLLLDRSFTDRFKVVYEGNKSTSTDRNQIVVGFQISIDAGHKDAVAEAEITISGAEVQLVSLMPRDKTYNVASVTKDAKAIDLGAVAQFVGVGATVGKTQESLYLVKDTDTVALERPGLSWDG